MRISTKPSINLLTLSYGWNKTKLLDKYKEKGHFSLFLLEAISRSALPKFEYQGKKHPLQENKSWYGAFERDMKEVYRIFSTEIVHASKNNSFAEAKRFKPQLEYLLKSFGAYKTNVKAVILSPNWFGIEGEGYGPLIDGIAYAIFTPSKKTNQTWLMVHETCHSFLLQTMKSKKVKSLIKDTEPLLYSWSTKKFRQYYPKWEWVIEEYLIHAIEQRVTDSSVASKKAAGMNRVDWFIKSWQFFQETRSQQDSVEDWIVQTLMQLKSKIKR
ncbi:MAG: hypothetical protein U0487_00445 [Patescibacteria group bacterium]